MGGQGGGRSEQLGKAEGGGQSGCLFCAAPTQAEVCLCENGWRDEGEGGGGGGERASVIAQFA